jgi:hypothetical protein
MAQTLIGRSVDGLTLAERWTLAGRWIAQALYSPDRLPLRTIEAVGESASDCMRQLKERGLNPALYEYEYLQQPYES